VGSVDTNELEASMEYNCKKFNTEREGMKAQKNEHLPGNRTKQISCCSLPLKAKGRGEVFTGFWLGGPKARDHWEDLGVGGRITLRWTLGR